MHNPVVHFEMPYLDGKRVADFYTKAFGWKTQALGDKMRDYVTAETTETKNGRPVTPGAINGGFWKKNDSRPAQVPSIVIAVEDIKQAIYDVKAAGGEVIGEPDDIIGVGKYVSFYDTEGNRVSLLEPSSLQEDQA